MLRRTDLRTLGLFAGIGVVVALHWLTFYGAIKLSNASVAATCMAIGPIFLAVIEPWIARRSLRPARTRDRHRGAAGRGAGRRRHAGGHARRAHPRRDLGAAGRDLRVAQQAPRGAGRPAARHVGGTRVRHGLPDRRHVALAGRGRLVRRARRSATCCCSRSSPSPARCCRSRSRCAPCGTRAPSRPSWP